MNENMDLEKQLDNIGKELKEIKTFFENSYKFYSTYQELWAHTVKMMDYLEQQMIENTKKLDALGERINDDEE